MVRRRAELVMLLAFVLAVLTACGGGKKGGY
jgi:predicted small lipoprotein YifL